jgi:hypothetical protein
VEEAASGGKTADNRPISAFARKHRKHGISLITSILFSVGGAARGHKAKDDDESVFFFFFRPLFLPLRFVIPRFRAQTGPGPFPGIYVIVELDGSGEAGRVRDTSLGTIKVKERPFLTPDKKASNSAGESQGCEMQPSRDRPGPRPRASRPSGTRRLGVLWGDGRWAMGDGRWAAGGEGAGRSWRWW